MYSRPRCWLSVGGRAACAAAGGPLVGGATTASHPSFGRARQLVQSGDVGEMISLEARVPLLDHKLVEFAAALPRSAKFGLRRSKHLLRQVAARYLPDSILSRPKQGFAIPLAQWLQEDLREWMRDILQSERCRQRGLFRGAAIDAMIETHLQGRRDYSQQLWALLVLELWFNRSGK